MEEQAEASAPLAIPEPLTPTRRKSQRTKFCHDFNRYEITVMTITQLSYFPVTASMLSTSFFEPSSDFCRAFNTTQGYPPNSSEFHSLLFDWKLACKDSSLLPLSVAAIMTGALVGSFIAGFLADRCGRCPVMRGTLFMLAASNLFISLFASISPYLSLLLYFAMGIACGGYMVVNLILFVECLELPESRLFAVSVNGWSFSMIFTALLAIFTLNWRIYHFVICGAATAAFFACQFSLVESCRWLDSAQRSGDARRNALFVAKKNRYFVHPDWSWWEILRFSSSAAHHAITDEESTSSNTPNYVDMFKYSPMYILALVYCFSATSFVSFGGYSTLDILPGNRYHNMMVMGGLKFGLGWIPYLLRRFGRKTVVTCSVGIASCCGWADFFLHQSFGDTFIHTILFVLMSSTLDPTWKILHLYSAELFPTSIRNMARGVCNLGSRLGSILASSTILIRGIHAQAPLLVFTVFLTIQFFVVLKCLPETKNRPLPSELQSKEPREPEQREIS